TVYASWSERMPAATYAFRSRPRTPGACPSTCCASSSFASSCSSAETTPGKFIISARPRTRRRRRSASRSPVVSARRGDSKREAGTDEDAMNHTSSGIRPQTSSSQCTPSVPSTFAISCGSATTAVVPNGSTSRANSSTSSFDDSRCMCASTNPGTTKRPSASSVSRPSYAPSPATKPSTTATSVSSHSRVKTEKTRPPRTTRSAGSSPRATESRRESAEAIVAGNRTVRPMEVLTPRTLDEALQLKAEHPDALPIQGGTDVMVAMNFDRARPAAVLNLNEVQALRGWARDGGALRLGSGLTYTEAMTGELAELLPALAEAARTVGSPQIRNRGTIGGNLGTASPAGDALPPLAIDGAEVECASVRGVRTLPLTEFVTGVKRTALAGDELITAVRLTPSRSPQTFMKV